jgi:hypothetical protein
MCSTESIDSFVAPRGDTSDVDGFLTAKSREVTFRGLRLLAAGGGP